MISLYTFLTPQHECSYLADQRAVLRYQVVSELEADEYGDLMATGWRRFGYMLFRPECGACQACESIRVVVPEFRPNTSQKRAWKANRDVRLVVGEPSATDEKLALYDKFHRFQSDAKGWRDHGKETLEAYQESFVLHPYPTQEWCYYLGEKLLGVGYVDATPVGLSAIYFFYDPDERDRSLGTFNVLSILAAARKRKDQHTYLGYYVSGCGSLEYKANFQPNEVLDDENHWVSFRKR
jgi:leucyl-tRNA---protein transferase